MHSLAEGQQEPEPRSRPAAKLRGRACAVRHAVFVLAACLLGAGGGRQVAAQMDVLSPRNRELFVRFPVPILVRLNGQESTDPDVSLLIELDGEQIYYAPASMVIETELYELDEGPHEFAFLTLRGGGQIIEKHSLNISVRTDTDQNDLIYYIPPKDAARPRVFHWLVTPRDAEPQVPADLAKAYPTLFYDADGAGADRKAAGEGESEVREQLAAWARKQNEIHRSPDAFADAR